MSEAQAVEVSVKENHASGAQVTRPAGDVIRDSFAQLRNIILGLPPMLSTQVSLTHLIDLETWLDIALKDFVNYKNQMKAQEDSTKAQSDDNDAIADTPPVAEPTIQ